MIMDGFMILSQASGVDYPNALVDSMITKATTQGPEERCTLCAQDGTTGVCRIAKDGKHVTRTHHDPVGKCINPTTGEPVSARREATALTPHADSVQDSEDGNGTGLCPLCTTRVKLSSKGYITAHTVRRENIPAPPPAVRLKERQAEVTDSGVRTGSPDASMRTRDAEIQGYAGTGTVDIEIKIPDGEVRARVRDVIRTENGGRPAEWVEIECLPAGAGDKLRDGARRETVRVPATLKNIRTALRQEMAKRQRKNKQGDMVGGPDQAKVAMLSAMLRAATGESALRAPDGSGTYRVVKAVALGAATVDTMGSIGNGRDERQRPARPDGDRGTGHVPTSPGAPLVNGRSMTGAAPTERDRVNRKGKPKNAIGWSEPVGRARVDAVASGRETAQECGAKKKKGDRCTVTGCTATVGGRYGYLTCAEFRALPTDRARKRYHANVKRDRMRAEARAERARELAASPLYGRGAGTGHLPSAEGTRRMVEAAHGEAMRIARGGQPTVYRLDSST